MTYFEQIDVLAEDTADQLVQIVTSLDEGRIDRAEAIALIAAFLAAANVRATVLADLALSAQITAGTGTSVPVLGLTRPDEAARLHRAASTLLERLPPDLEAAEAQIRRIGRAEPLKAASDARSDGIARSPLVEGWVRDRNGDECELCTWWWREGRVWPKNHPMPRHTGCVCTQRVVLVERVREVQH